MTKQKSVLVVEDDQALREVYQIILEAAGFTVDTAKNGVEGLEQIKRLRPDVVLLDIFMPVMDGREVLRNLDRSLYPHTKIVVCSNMSDNQLMQEVLDNGADKFVLKSSLGPTELQAMVKELVVS